MTELTAEPFEGDKLNRQEYANGLISFIERLRSGVIAIDGDWGTGKSWLGVNIKQSIDKKAFASTIWIDAFAADWDDDPSLSLIAGIVGQIEDLEKNTWLKKTAGCLARLVPIGGKAAVQVAGNAIGLNKDVLDGLSEGIKEGSQAFIEQRLKDLADRQKTLAHLKGLLTDAVSKTHGQKIVVFIDELDRCSPEYAIRFLERIKHLFELDHVIYVIFWNRQQIQQTVESFYGPGTNGQMYLDKFIDFQLHLSRSHVRGDAGPMRGLLESLVARFEGVEQLSLTENIHWINSFATFLSLNARESERLAKWWVMSSNRNVVVLETWLLALKVKHPNLFARMRDGKPDAHLDAKKLLDGMPNNENSSHVITAIADIHDRYQSDNFNNLNEVASELLGRGYINPKNVLPAAIRRIETFN
ncbi:MAG: KAP family P-loop NTPase fold protein [Fluviibacter sp.]